MPLTLLANIDVDDLARAEAFYVQALGLKVGRRFGDDAGGGHGGAGARAGRGAG